MAHVHRVHKTFSIGMLTTRSFLHSCRILLPLETARAKQARTREGVLLKLLHRNPAKASGRELYFKDLVAATKEAVGGDSRALPKQSHWYLMATHAEMHKGLPSEDRGHI